MIYEDGWKIVHVELDKSWLAWVRFDDHDIDAVYLHGGSWLLCHSEKIIMIIIVVFSVYIV